MKEGTTMQSLLRDDEERLRNTLRANESVDKSRELLTDTLDEELGSLLLRYNAACAPDRMRQALAESMTAVLRDCLELLKAGGAEKDVPRRELSGWAVLLLLLSAAAAAAGLLLVGRLPVVGICCAAAAVIAAFAAGLGWFRKREVAVRPTVDPERVWATLRRSGETVDRKIDEFCARAVEWTAARPGREEDLPGWEELQLFGDLLEALYADNGDFALRQLRKVLPCLLELGIETEDLRADNADLFEILPSRNPGMTLRPALKAGERLLLPGRATGRADGAQEAAR
ncbi:MAG: hypothetical protein IJK35_09845 [Oscillospiraceae bacterium]|nr:hypothetical protein [Oscillospiraceae bacterium]